MTHLFSNRPLPQLEGKAVPAHATDEPTKADIAEDLVRHKSVIDVKTIKYIHRS